MEIHPPMPGVTMSLVRNLVQRASGAATRRPRGGARPRAGGTTRRQDEAIGRGVRSLLGRARRR